MKHFLNPEILDKYDIIAFNTLLQKSQRLKFDESL